MADPRDVIVTEADYSQAATPYVVRSYCVPDPVLAVLDEIIVDGDDRLTFVATDGSTTQTDVTGTEIRQQGHFGPTTLTVDLEEFGYDEPMILDTAALVDAEDSDDGADDADDTAADTGGDAG